MHVFAYRYGCVEKCAVCPVGVREWVRLGAWAWALACVCVWVHGYVYSCVPVSVCVCGKFMCDIMLMHGLNCRTPDIACGYMGA